jgi:hypothetical protein
VRNVVLKFVFMFTLLSASVISAKYYSNLEGSDFLEFPQIKSLLTKIKPDRVAVARLGNLLNTVFSSKNPKQKDISFAFNEDTKKAFFRVTQWNLETVGINSVQNNFNDFHENDKFLLNSTHIFTLNNVGFYNEKSGFRNMAEIFAEAINANYVFAPEFLEASPEILKKADLDYDFRALTGNAIVSKFPILSAKVLRLPACYDWFYEEEQRILYDPYARKKIKNRAGEGQVNLIRRGGRIALFADILLPNDDVITVVSSQLENRAESKCRQRQLESALYYMKSFHRPIVYGVDLNNIEKSAAPQTLAAVVEKTAKDPKFYAKKIISALNPFSLITSLTSMTYGKCRVNTDPTVRNIPLILPNNSYKLFQSIFNFQFDDSSQFDFSGENTLANSNERVERKYLKTYEYKKFIGKGRYKLDWIFVKPIYLSNNVKTYYPAEATTLNSIAFNQNLDTLSLHYPISVKVNI